MDEQLFEDEGFENDAEAIDESVVSESPQETETDSGETFENITEAETQPSQSDSTLASDSSPYEWVTADWGTMNITPNEELSSRLETTASENAKSGEQLAQTNNDSFFDKALDKAKDVLSAPKDLVERMGMKAEFEATKERLQNDFKEIEAQYPRYDQDSGYGTQLQEVAPSKEQLEAAKEKGFNKDYYEYAKSNSTVEQWDTNAFGWGLYNGEPTPMNAAGEYLEEMKRYANSGREGKYNEAKQNFEKSIEDFQNLKAYATVWNPDGTLAEKSADNVLIDLTKNWLGTRVRIANAMNEFIENPNKNTLRDYNEALKSQTSKEFRDADNKLAELMDNPIYKDGVDQIHSRDPINDELMDMFERAKEEFLENEKESRRKELEKETQLARARAMSEDELLQALKDNTISADVYNQVVQENKEAEISRLKEIENNGLDKLSSKELSDYATDAYKAGAIDYDTFMSILEVDVPNKREKEQEENKNYEEVKKSVEEKLSDNDKSNDLAALNELDEARKEKGTISFDNKEDLLEITNEKGETETKSVDEFIAEVLDPGSEFNTNPELWDVSSVSPSTASRVAEIIGRVNPNLQTFIDLVFNSNWDAMNTKSGQEYVRVTNELKSNLSDIWSKDGNFFGKVFSSIKEIFSAAKEYKEVTKDTAAYKLVRSAQTMITRTLTTALAAISGMPAMAISLYVASLGKEIVASKLSEMGFDTAAGVMRIEQDVKDSSESNETTSKAISGRMISKNSSEAPSIDYKGYNKGLEENEVARKEVPSDFILKVFKKEPKTFAWIKNV